MVKSFTVDVVPQVLSWLTTDVGSEIDVFRLERWKF
jgi:hypothetical protein